VNPNGGAIALGHPAGHVGRAHHGHARRSRLRARNGKQRTLATMCIGVGQGIAIALGNP
jgi:acetyl-CoA acyltransferase